MQGKNLLDCANKNWIVSDGRRQYLMMKQGQMNVVLEAKEGGQFFEYVLKNRMCVTYPILECYI